ncbi:cell surface protein [Rickettsia bellii]|uniref:Putative cell surface antigen Sca13 n=1 Tax=Rickettsia bellii str. RML An4 TaxID=1359193 RepID=A0A0F3Q917_RICBE|nr:S-layer family protein [Rickettsia bellii]ARD85897.1 cell surface protein [Rickettsia bellii]KJV89055.1 putative cell surface antigen Sca13 [Rickettsia bellii str. RML An4]
MEFKGTGNITVNPTINTANPITTLLNGQLILGNVNTSINFVAATNLTVNNVTGQMDLAGQAGEIDVNADATVGNIISSNGVVGAAILGNNVKTGDIINVGTVNFNGAGTSNSIQNALAVNFQAAGQVTLTNASSAGTFTIAQSGTVVNAANGVQGDVAAGDGNFNSSLITGNATVGGGTITSNISGTATYTGAGTITATTIGGQTDFDGNEGILNINDTGTVGIVTSSNPTAQAGTVKITSPSGPSTFTVNNADAQVNTAASPAALTGTVAAGDGAVFATITGNASVNAGSITGSISKDATITATGQITGNVDGNATVNSGQLTGNTGGNASVGVNGQITGNIGGTATYTGAGTITATTIGGQTDLAGFAGVLNVNANGTVENVISSNGVVGEAMLGDSVTTGDIINVATVNFAGAGTINSIQNAGAVNFNGPGLVTLTNASSAGTFTIVQDGTVVNDSNGVTGNVVAGDGQFNSNIDGSASVNDGTITGGISQNATITGDGQINGSVGGNADVNAGQLTGDVTGNTTVTTGQMTGNTGGTLSLGAGHVAGNVGNSVTFTAAGGALDTTTVGGEIDFAGNNSTVTVADTGSLTSVTSSTTTAGNVGFAAEANVTGAINNISTIVIEGATGKTVTFGDDISVTSLGFTNGEQLI